MLASCVSSTPESRIAARPATFEKLSETEQDLVRQGELAKGMGQSAVALAWGSPDRSFDGFKDGRRTERWDYVGTRRHVTNNVFGSYRSGSYRSRYGRDYSFDGFGFGFGPEITYLPFLEKSVIFEGGKVIEWQQVRDRSF